MTIFKDIRPEHRLAREEIFGPVLSVMKANTFGEAIEIANGTEFALTGGVFSRSPRHIAEAKRHFQVGNLYINRGCTGATVERHPFGGFKMSGVGSKAGGPDYLLQFMLPRNVVENTIRRGFAPTGWRGGVVIPRGRSAIRSGRAGAHSVYCPSWRQGAPGGVPLHPRPTNGILVAITFMNSTLASKGRFAM